MTFFGRGSVFFLIGILLFSCTPKSSLQKLQKVDGISEVRGMISLSHGAILIFGKEPGKKDPINGDLSRARIVLVDTPDKMNLETNTSRILLDQIGDIISVVEVGGKNLSRHFYALNRRMVVMEATHQLAPVYQIFHSDDRGATWEIVTETKSRDPAQWPHLDFIDSERGWMADNENWYRTDDGGKTWILTQNKLPAGSLKKFVALNSKTLIYGKENHLIWADQNLATTAEVTLETSFRLVTLHRQGDGNIIAVGYDVEKKKVAPIRFEILSVSPETRKVERGAFLPPNFLIETMNCYESCFFAGSQFVARDVQKKLYEYDFTKKNIKEWELPSRHAPPFLTWDHDLEYLMVLQSYTSRTGQDFFLYKIVNN